MRDMMKSRFMENVSVIERLAFDMVKWSSLPANPTMYKDQYLTIQASAKWENKKSIKIWLNHFSEKGDLLVFDTSEREDGDYVFRRGTWVKYLRMMHRATRENRRAKQLIMVGTIKRNHSAVDDANFFINSSVIKNGEP
ncbi:hypothetical protein IKF57_02530 [Candidatus Saccharibacteria bacterium]|nr:hypothetical protein [Candidatus Saccharibacteria bacterium]